MGQPGGTGHRPITAIQAIGTYGIIGAMITFTGPLPPDGIVEPACIPRFDLAASGYTEAEFLVSGMAQSYELTGPAGADGRWDARRAGAAPFTTRIVVRRPADPAAFSGTLLAEWLNVSSGFDGDPDWAFTHEEIFRAGHAYVAVSAQAVGVIGGQGLLGVPGLATPGLRGSNHDRYGSVEHPGDRFAFGLFGAIGRALRDGQASDQVLGGLVPGRVLALGESQSAFCLTSYINAVHSLEAVFDGFLVHSRGAGATPLDGVWFDPSGATTGIGIRIDNQSPVLILVAEGDVVPPLAFGLARQPDSDSLRTWEMAGTSHADDYLLGDAAPLLGCDWRINEGPHRFVAQAALRALDRWVSEGVAPPCAPPIELAAQRPPVIARDAAGIALGGVRTPAVDVPVAVLSGEGPAGADGPGWLAGSTVPLPAAELISRYGDAAGYLAAYSASLDAAIEAGFLLPEHRAELLGQARGFAFPPAGRQ